MDTDKGCTIFSDIPVSAAQTRVHLCQLMNIHFMILPDFMFVKKIRSEVFISILEELSNENVLWPELSEGSSLMLEYIRSTAQIEASKFSDILGVDRTRLYRGIKPGYGPPPPCEAVWTEHTHDAAAVLQELSEVYRKSGMIVSDEAKERPDYIGVELEYLSQLAVQEIEAWQSGNEDKARELLAKQYHFLIEHPGRWMPRFIEESLSMADTDFYKGHLSMLHSFLAHEQKRIDIIIKN
ncbi:MAG: molecular chaperone TorD family protein [Dehalobacter sp.]|nr:molecular chaperone TorD family protein [Dehalobacter sp.]